MTTKSRWIYRSLIESPYYIGLCVSEDQFQSELKKLGVPAQNWPDWVSRHKGGATHTFEQKKTGNLCALICVRSKSKDPNAIVGVLVHEAVHVWQHIREEIGETDPGKEFEAYSIQIISQRLIAKYSELTNTKKKKG